MSRFCSSLRRLVSLRLIRSPVYSITLRRRMWILAKHDPESHWMREAIDYSRPLEPRQFDRNVHDLGFIFMSTYKRWFDMTGSAEQQQVLIQAGRTMGLRFREKGQYLR